MSGAGNFFVRWRVRLGYPLAIAVLYFSRPTPRSILLGALAGVIGLWVRAYAAGYLHKQEVLTVTGPYAYSRNPLYLGAKLPGDSADSFSLAQYKKNHEWQAAVGFLFLLLVLLVIWRLRPY
jgi:protein-S-isoprenylcysteine O-methyltransferase Ste14